MTTYNTGNPIGSTDSRDRLDNTENMDYLENSTTELTHADRLGTVRKTRHGMEVEHDAQIAAHETEHNAQISAHEVEHDNQMQSFENDFDSRLAGMAFTRVGTFTGGYTLTDMRQTLLWEISQGGDGHEYGWSGAFPKVVPASSTPASTGGISVGTWISRFDPELRIQVREALRRSYAEAGYNLVAGSFEVGGTLVNSNDVLLHEASGKAFSGPAGTVAAGTNPASGGFVDKSVDFVFVNSEFVFSSVEKLKEFAGIDSSLLDITDIKVKTQSYYGNWAALKEPSGGAEYIATTLQRVRDSKNNQLWEPDGYGDHYLLGGTTYVAVLSSNQFHIDQYGADPFGNNNSSPSINACAVAASISTDTPNWKTNDSAIGAADGTNVTRFGATVKLGIGVYKCDDKITLPAIIVDTNQTTGNKTKYSGISLKGEGLSCSVLDFSASSGDSVAIDGGFNTISDFQILRSQGIALNVGALTATDEFAWQVDVHNVYVNGGVSHGIRTNRIFRSAIKRNLVYKVGGYGFVFDSAMTSTTVENNYANTCNGGYICGNPYDINLSSSSVYCSFISNACDSSNSAYTFAACRGFSLAGNGSEVIATNSITMINSSINIAGHFSDRCTGHDILTLGNKGYYTIDNLVVEGSPNTATQTIRFASSNTRAQIGLVTTDKGKLWNAGNPTLIANLQDSSNIVTKSVSGASAVTVANLKHPSGFTETYGGTLTVTVVNGSVINPDSSGNITSYTLQVVKGANGSQIKEVSYLGLKTGVSDQDPGTWPSFDFTLSGDSLQAIHTNTSATLRQFTFSIECDGIVKSV